MQKIGYNSNTYQTEDDRLIAVVAMLNDPNPPPPPPALKRIKVLGAAGSYLNIRTGPGITFLDIGNLPAGSVCDVYGAQKDGAGNEWVRINNDQQWIARIYNGNEKAVWG